MDSLHEAFQTLRLSNNVLINLLPHIKSTPSSILTYYQICESLLQSLIYFSLTSSFILAGKPRRTGGRRAPVAVCLSITPASSYAGANVGPVCSALFFRLGAGSLSELQRGPQDQRSFSPQDEKSPNQRRSQKVLLHLPGTRAKNHRFTVVLVINPCLLSYKNNTALSPLLTNICLSSGPICASTTSAEPDKDRVTRMDIADVREVLNKQRREIETLQLVVDVDGNLVNEMKLLRKESRNMNSRVTQLYMQLLHEIIRKRDNSLELAQLENRVLNVTSEMIRLASRYKELEARYAIMAGVVNNQSVLISALEEQCMRTLGRSELPVVPPLVQVVPQNIPVNNRFTNEIQRDNNNQAFSRGSHRNPPTVSPFVINPPPPQGTLTSDGEYKCLERLTFAYVKHVKHSF